MEARQLTSLVRQLAARTMNDKERLGLVSMWAPFVYLSCSQVGPGVGEGFHLHTLAALP
jgi:hypothetical protein